jgi:hypothetical protein
VTADNRVTALRFAIDAMAVDGNLSAADAGDVTATACVFYRWLEGPAIMVLAFDTLTYQQASPDGPGTPVVKKGSTVQLTDTQQVTLSVAEQDSKGQPVADTLAWSVDNGSVISLVPSADSQSCLCVAGTDGTATVTVTDNSVTPPLSATDVLTVVSSAATSLVVSEGTAEAQPPAATTPAPAS